MNTTLKLVDTKRMDWLENINVQALAAEQSIKELNKKYNTTYEVVVFDAQTNDANLEKAKASIDLEATNGFTMGNKIYINRNTKNPYSVVLGHELKHSLEQTKNYQKLHDTVLSEIKNKDALMEQKRLLYSGVDTYEQSENKDYYLEQEIVADYIGSTLFSDYKQIKKLYQMNRNVFTRVYEWVKERLGRTQTAPERESLIKIRDMFKKSLQEVKQESQETRLAIGKDEKLGDIAYIDKDILDLKPGDDVKQKVKEYFDINLKGLEIEVISNGNKIHLQQSKKYIDLIEQNKKKAKTVQILDDMIRIAKNHRFLPDINPNNSKKHMQLSASRGFDYYNTQFMITNYSTGNKVYYGRLVIRKSADGKDYFYDLEQISKIDERTKFSINKKARAEAHIQEPNPELEEASTLTTSNINEDKTYVNSNVKYSLNEQRFEAKTISTLKKVNVFGAER